MTSFDTSDSHTRDTFLICHSCQLIKSLAVGSKLNVTRRKNMMFRKPRMTKGALQWLVGSHLKLTRYFRNSHFFHCPYCITVLAAFYRQLGRLSYYYCYNNLCQSRREIDAWWGHNTITRNAQLGCKEPCWWFPNLRRRDKTFQILPCKTDRSLVSPYFLVVGLWYDTDDDQYLGNSSEHLGEISVRINRCTIGEINMNKMKKVDLSDKAIHERSKKAMVHQVRYFNANIFNSLISRAW